MCKNKTNASQQRRNSKILGDLVKVDWLDTNEHKKIAIRHNVNKDFVVELAAAYADFLNEFTAAKNLAATRNKDNAKLRREIEHLRSMQPPLPTAGQWQQAELREREAFSFLSDEEKIKLKIGVA